MSAPESQLSTDELEALDTARALLAAGVPLFLAAPAPSHPLGFALPQAWQQTELDPSVVDRWTPGMALCAVMGHALDLLDFDPRNDGDLASLGCATPTAYLIAATPSGGFHMFIAPLGTGSRDKVYPGIDVKSGTPEGTGRGFAFIAPTVRVSKVTGEPTPYQWLQVSDLKKLGVTCANDDSGAELAARVRELLVGTGSVVKAASSGPDWWLKFAAAKAPQSEKAARFAISNKLEEVRTWDTAGSTGFRQVLLRAAMTLGGYVGSGYLDEHEAREKLIEAVSAVYGTPDEQDELWITQGLTDGAMQPFAVFTPAQEAVWAAENGLATGTTWDDYDDEDYDDWEPPVGNTPSGPPWTIYSAIGTDPFDPAGGSDQELAEQVVTRMSPALRFAADAGTWVVRDREVWVEREDAAAWSVATLARLMPIGDPDLPAKKADYSPENWTFSRRLRFMNSGTAGPIERKVRAITRMSGHAGTVELAQLDGDPEVLWAGGLPWDLRASGNGPVLAQIDPTTPHLRSAACLPQSLPTPHWDRFLATVWPDPEVRAWAMRVLSIALAGYPDAALPVLYGPERTGKTALVTLLVRVLGSYGHAADPRLLGGADGTHASVVYALKGRRLSFIDEGPRRGHLASERLKQLTGGGHLTGNAMRSNPVTFAPTHTLVMTTNDEPPITDPALKARMRIIPCESDKGTVRLARQALTPAVWAAEAPGVLASMMRECAYWIADPDSAGSDRAPKKLRGAVDEMAAAQDPIREWVEDCTVATHPGTQARPLYRAFLAWFENRPGLRRMTPPTETSFGRSLTDQGYPVVPNQGPKKNLNYRPLSVLNGPPAGFVVPTPTGQTSAPRPAPAPSAPHTGSDGVPTDDRRSSGEPSESQTPSSTPLFSTSSDSSDSTYTNIEGVKSTTHIYRPYGVPTAGDGTNRGKLSAIGDDHENTAPDLGLRGVSASFGESPKPRVSDLPPLGPAEKTGADLGKQESDPQDDAAETATDLRKLAELRVDLPVDLPADYSPLRNITPLQVTIWANARQISKTEARGELKALKAQVKAADKVADHQAAMSLAAGEHIGLPAVADRAGNMVQLSGDQVLSVVRACLGRTGGALTVDIENSGYPMGHEHYLLRTIQLGDREAAVVLDATDPEQTALAEVLLAEASFLHAHSSTADLVPLVAANLVELESAWDRMFDTVIPAKLGDPQSTGSDPGLKKLAGTVLGTRSVAPVADEARSALFKAGRWLTETKVDTPLEKSGWAQVDYTRSTMIRYAASDVLDTAALAQELPQAAPAIVARERLAQRMTARVAHHGVRLDGEHVSAKLAEHRPAREAAGVLVQAFGIEKPGSGQQIAAALVARGANLPLTPTGAPSVDKKALEPLRTADGEVGDLVRAVLDYRHHDTVIGTFLEPYEALCLRGDGRARPTVYTLGTDTGRMSCVAADTLVDMPRDLVAHPDGIPITEVKAGDWVYAFDWRRELVLQQVKWCAQTGVRQTMIITAENSDGHQLTLRATPEHLIRLRNGDWRPTGSLMHLHGRPHRDDGPRLMTMVRRTVDDGYVKFFPHSNAKGTGVKGGGKSREHRWVLEQVENRKISTKADVHHKDGNRANNHPGNLEALTVAEHRGARHIHPGWGDGRGCTPPELYAGPTDYHVTSVEFGPIEPVWDMEVEGAHNFIANGICVHNCVRPNLQQLPRRGGVRACITADLGQLMIGADFSGVEIRVAAALSGDPFLRQVLADGRDIHEEIALQVWGADPETSAKKGYPAPLKEHRYLAKAMVFGRIYGSGVPGMAASNGQPLAVAQAVIDTLDAMTPGLTAWSASIRDAVKRGHTQYSSYSGRIIHFDQSLPHKAPNYAIQGSARELLVDALIKWRDTRWGTSVILPVHDELLSVVPEDEADDALATLVSCMETELFGIKIVAESDTPSFAWQDSS